MASSANYLFNISPDVFTAEFTCQYELEHGYRELFPLSSRSRPAAPQGTSTQVVTAPQGTATQVVTASQGTATQTAVPSHANAPRDNVGEGSSAPPDGPAQKQGKHARASGNNTAPPRLAPSVEEAYRKKAIEMRRRTLEVEEQNDEMRLRNERLRRGIMKLRLERAILTMHLKNTQTKNGAGIIPTFDEDSENSSDAAPPTPQERPLRTKRSHRRVAEVSSPSDPHQSGLPAGAGPHAQIAPLTGMTTPMTASSAGPHTGISMANQGHVYPPEAVVHRVFNPQTDLLPPGVPDYDPNDPATFPPGPPDPPAKLFKLHMTRELIPVFTDYFGIIPTPEARDVRAQQFWDQELGQSYKSAWIAIHDDLARRWADSQRQLNWGRGTANIVRGEESGMAAGINAEMGEDSEKGDGDTVMMGVEEDEEGGR